MTWQQVVELQSVQSAARTTSSPTHMSKPSVAERGIAQLEKLDKDQLKVVFFVLVTGLGLRLLAVATELMPSTIVARLLHKGVELGFFCLFLVMVMAIYKKAHGIKVIW